MVLGTLTLVIFLCNRSYWDCQYLSGGRDYDVGGIYV